MRKIKANKIKCKCCNEIIESKSVHDFKLCSCRKVAVDGGLDYLRRCGSLDDIIELSEFEDEDEKHQEVDITVENRDKYDRKRLKDILKENKFELNNHRID